MAKKKEKSMTPQKLYDHIVKHMTPEQALLKLLESSIVSYEKLKFETEEEMLHPLIVISMAAMDMRWGVILEGKGEEEVRGLIIGNKAYLNDMMKLMKGKPKEVKIKIQKAKNNG